MMEFIDIDTARSKDLIPLTVWLRDIPMERVILQKGYDQVMKNNGRRAAFVKNGGLIALFVDNVAANSYPSYKSLKKR